MVNAGFGDYSADSSSASESVGSGNQSAWDKPKTWTHDRCKRAYTDYLNSKVQEVQEQKEARRYRHASQWNDEQIKVFKKRKQPIVTYNRVGKKIDAVVGLIEKLKQSPKAYPRTPNEEGSADLATQVIREVLDESEWKAKSYLVGQDGAMDGIGGVELIIEPGDMGDPTVSFEKVEVDSFFYDPRSIRLDFSDCRFMGQGKWLDIDQAREMFPDSADDIDDALESGSDLSTNSDREQKWFITDGYVKRVRVVDLWYILNGEWYYAIFTGVGILQEGPSWLHDEKKKTFCKYIMYSAQVDQDGDRYGFIRNLKSAQDEINQRRSKALHLLNSRRLIAEQGAFDDLELARREAVRPDGIVVYNKGFETKFDDGSKNQEIQAHLEFLVDAKSEIENFGPNPALIGQGSLGDKSGRAIQLLQQAGIAELGPFLLAFRGWKIRLYRAIWNAVREHWRQERYIRVTDDQSVVQFISINQVGINPASGMPSMVNHLASLDVDIIMDEGPDSINSMADTYDALIALVQNGAQVPPDVLLELAPGIDPETRKRLIERLQAPNPIQQSQQQLEMQNAQATIAKTAAQAKLANAQAVAAIAGVQQGPDVNIEQPENPAVIAADIENKQADTLHKKAQALAAIHKSVLEPDQQAHQQMMDKANLAQEQTVNAPEPGPSLDEQKFQHQREMDHAKLQLEREKITAAAKAKSDSQSGSVSPTGAPVAISVDGTMANKLNEHAKANTDTMNAISSVLAKATETLAQASKSMADSSQQMTDSVQQMAKAITAPKKLVRDAKGRASHVETVIQ